MNWHRREVALKFGVGDWTFLSVCLPMHVRAVGLAETLPPEAAPAAPQQPALDDAAGYMVRSLPVLGMLPVLSQDRSFIRYVTLQYAHCYIDLRIGLEAYRAKFSAKTRSTLTRKLRKFQEHCGGSLKWKTYASADVVDEFHRLAREVSAKTYQERLLDAGIPGDPAFVERMRLLAAEDKLRAYVLFHDERPVSYLYCPVEDRQVIYAYLGYDPEYMKHSVGTVLQWLALEQLFEERKFDIFDFTEGQSEHKRLFATHEVPRANVMFVRRSLRHVLIVRAHWAMQKLSAAAGELAQRWGVKASLRRLLRFGYEGQR